MKFDKPILEEICKENIIDGDIIMIEKSKQIEYEIKYFNSTHCKFEDGVFYEIVDNSVYELDDDFIYTFHLHNYIFIANEGSWYIEGRECYPCFNHDSYSIFQGFTYKDSEYNMETTGILWDGESCSYDEFIITPRINQERTRKLKRILNK